MTSIGAKWWTLVATITVASLAGCEATSGDEDVGLVCPTCQRAGGETTDFGATSPCTVEPTPFPSELERMFHVNEARARAEGHFRSSLHWTVEGFGLPADESLVEARPSGYAEKTWVDTTISLGEPVYYKGRNVVDPSMSATCPESVKLSAKVNITFADGALQPVTVNGQLTIWRDGLLPVLVAAADLAAVHGALNLHLDSRRAFKGSLSTSIYFFPDGPRGSIGIFVLPADLKPPIGLPIAPTAWGQLIGAQWPDDECPAHQFPIDADSEHPWLDGNTFGKIYSDWRTEIEGVGPSPGRWLDGRDVQIDVELDTPQHGCLGTYTGGPPYFDFRSNSRLVSSDGRLRAKLAGGSVADQMFSLSSAQGPQLSVDEFQRSSGIAGVDPSGSAWLSAYFEVSYKRTDQGLDVSGELHVDGQPMCALRDRLCAADPHEFGASLDCLQWPPPSEFPEICGRQLR